MQQSRKLAELIFENQASNQSNCSPKEKPFLKSLKNRFSHLDPFFQGYYIPDFSCVFPFFGFFSLPSLFSVQMAHVWYNSNYTESPPSSFLSVPFISFLKKLCKYSGTVIFVNEMGKNYLENIQNELLALPILQFQLLRFFFLPFLTSRQIHRFS